MILKAMKLFTKSAPFILFSLSMFAQDLTLKENRYLGYIYQQNSYQLDDPKGDALLLWTAHQVPQSVKASLKGKATELFRERQQIFEKLLQIYPEYIPAQETKNVIVANYETHNPNHLAIELEGHRAPFRIPSLANMMKQVMVEELQSGLSPREGTIHTWSPSTQRELKSRYKVFARMPKLLVALARGTTSFYMRTDSEDQLVDYILTRPKNSIGLEEMFRASYRINQGDVYLTLLTVENILSRYWLEPDRNKREVTTRLKDITNYNYYTDKFGAWYHLFGIMLYGYAHGSLSARVVGTIESLGSQILSKFQEDERQESFINKRGGPVGARLRRFVRHKKIESFKSDPSLTHEENYLQLDEDFSKRLEKARKRKDKK